MSLSKTLTPTDALEIMCYKCDSFPMCHGTGCQPKKVLAELIEKNEKEKE